MVSEIFLKIKNEINAHPKEREGFTVEDIKSIPSDEEKELSDLLIKSIKEGKERCNTPLKWLLGDNYIERLKKETLSTKKSDHGYFFICYFLYKETEDHKMIEEMQEAVKHGDSQWDMRRSLLGRHLKEVMKPTYEYAKFCLYIIINDEDKHIKRTALLGFLEYKNINTDGYAIPQDYENILAKINSLDPEEKRRAAENLGHILEN